MIHGPCQICGLRNYNLSMGGPTICPTCDCGNFGHQLVANQRRRIEQLEAMVPERTYTQSDLEGIILRTEESIRLFDSGMLYPTVSMYGPELRMLIDAVRKSQSDLESLRERCAEIVDDLFAKYQRSPDAWAKGWRSACAEIEEQIRAFPITPHTEEGTK